MSEEIYLWRTLKGQARCFICCFQEGRREINPIDSFLFGTYYASETIWNKIEKRISDNFGMKINDKNRGEKQTFVELCRLNSSQGFLLCYGNTTRDRAGRLNTFYFYVEADYNKLKETFEIFKRTPITIRVFAATLFNWKNTSHEEGTSRENDLISDMKTIHFLELSKGNYSYLRKLKNRYNGNGEVFSISL